MIVDDEPFIRQGIQILIDWKKYGFEICGEASSGREAIELMQGMNVDLIITDIKMPEMNGIELIEYTWEHISEKIRFILLSGYYEFEYAKKAIKYDVADYILKPVQKEELVHALEDYKKQFKKWSEERKKLELSEKIVFDRYLSLLIAGNQDEESVFNVVKHLVDYTGVRYINVEYEQMENNFNKLSKDEKQKAQTLLYEALKDYLSEHWYHCYINPNSNEMKYSVGFIYVKKLADLEDISEKEYILKLYDAISSRLSEKIILHIGQKVDDINMISDSYKSATIGKRSKHFANINEITYCDEIESSTKRNKYRMDKDIMDNLIRAIEEHDTEKMNRRLNAVYDYFKEIVADPEIIKINLDYLLFNLINLTKELKPEFDQEEVNKIISQSGYNDIAISGNVTYLKKFAEEFSTYLHQLRQYALGGVLTEIENEITEHYMNNLSLKLLSEKYYINSAYLGQIFKKQYGISFKDYLNNYRIDRAAELLIRSDVMVYEVANAVGFNSTDYFISKFVELKGSTPLQYRKQVIHR